MCTINFNHEPELNYFDVVIGTKRTRTTLFLFKLPEESGKRADWFTWTRKQNNLDIQIGTKWILGLERVNP
jgi:hypothetical protein